MGLLDTVGSIGGDLLTGFMNNEAAMDRQSSAQAFSAEQYAKRYQTTVKDMEAAGLNPMLAYQGIGGSFPTGSPASSSGTPPLGQSYNQGKIASAQVANIEADTANKNASADLIAAQAAANWASAGQSESQRKLIDETVDKVRAEVANVSSDTLRIRAVIDNLVVQRDNLIKEGYNLTETGNQLRATISKLEAEVPLIRSQQFKTELDSIISKHEGSLRGLDVEAAQNFNNAGRSVKEIRPVLDLLKGVLRK